MAAGNEATAGSAVKHTGGEWKSGKIAGTVVSDKPAPGMLGGDYSEYYGGYLIAESIAKSNVPVLSAALDLFAACLAIVDCSGETEWANRQRSDRENQAMEKVRAAIAKATGR